MDDSTPYATSSRRRLTRTLPAFDESVTSASSVQAGPSRLPEVTQLVDVNFSQMDRDTDTDDHDTPRIPASSTLPSDTPAARLRALLSRVPNSSTPTPQTHTVPPPDDSATDDYESDFDKGESINATANSIARESLRDVFSRALRDPGDTPQKAGKRRSNSVEPSDTDETPRFESDRFRMKGKRKSLSDEEIENSHRTPIHSTFKSRGKPLTMEVLEQRYMNGQVDDDLGSPNKREEDEVTLSLLRDSGTSPPPATSTPQHSVRMSVDLGSQLQQSNLMDQDSEMQRLINGLDSYDAQQGISNGVWFPPSRDPSFEQSHGDHEAAFASNPGQASGPQTAEQSLPTGTSDGQSPRPKRWSFPKGNRTTPKRPDTITGTGKSPLTSRSLAALNDKRVSSPRYSEGSSRSGSMLSDVEQRDRIKDLEEDIVRQRERRWNKTTPRRSSLTSLHSNSPQSAERHRTQDGHGSSSRLDTARSETGSPSANRPMRRYNSLTSNRSISPTGSIHSVHTEDEPDPELVHLRERNWNSPRPVWPQPPGGEQRALSPGPSSTGPYSPHTRVRTRTMSTSSVGTDDSYNPASYTSPPSTSKTRYTPNGTPSSTHRRIDSSPSLGQPQGHQSRIPVSPSTIRKRTTSAVSSLSPPGQDGNRVRPTAVSMSGLRPDLNPSTSKSLSASPSRKHDYSRGLQSRPTKIPVKSPRKAVPVPGRSSGADFFPESESEWDDVAASNANQRKLSSFPSRLDPDDDLRIQELTPTLRTVAPPSTGSPERPHGAFPPSDHLDVPQDHDTNGLNDSTATVYAGPRRSELPTIMDSPPKPSSSSLKLEFASPSPPKDLPALPDPPSTDESNDGTGWKGFKPSRLFDANKSALQTPKAPGAWFDTPAPARRPRSYSDTTLRTPPTTEDAPANGPNFSTLKTPHAPGGWLATPTPAKPQYVDQSVETDTEGEADPAPLPALQTGLATPSSSLSKGTRPPQTPAAPGAWMNTPAGRKSVMKVRFDPDANETREFTKGESDASGTEGFGSSTNSQTTQTLSPPDTPDMEGQRVFPSPQKTPTIRVLDAYGNEQTEEEPQALFRIVDALGPAVQEVSPPEDTEQSIVVPPESKDELLSRVRRGLDELVSDMHEIDRAPPLSSSELARVKQLDSTSLQAREKRRRLSGEYKKNNNEFKDRFDSLRTSMQRGTSLDTTTTSNARWHFTSPRFFLLIALQVGLAIIMYRLSDSRVEELFKTAYYDPFEPHLYRNIFKSRLILSTSPERYVSWLSLLDLLREQGLKACALQTRDNLSIMLSAIQSFIWERFGDDGSYFNISWPPT